MLDIMLTGKDPAARSATASKLWFVTACVAVDVKAGYRWEVDCHCDTEQ